MGSDGVVELRGESSDGDRYTGKACRQIVVVIVIITKGNNSGSNRRRRRRSKRMVGGM